LQSVGAVRVLTYTASTFATVFTLTSSKFKLNHIVSRIYESVKLGEIEIEAKYESHRTKLSGADAGLGVAVGFGQAGPFCGQKPFSQTLP
jgi:hypothetical protein